MAVQIVFRPRFPVDALAAERPDASHSRAEQAIRRWQDLLGIQEGQRTEDFEDWHENAAQLLAAVDTGLPVFVMGHPQAFGEPSPVLARFNTTADPDPSAPTMLTGRLLRNDPIRSVLRVTWPDQQAIQAAIAYGDNPAFAGLAKRPVAMASYTMEGDLGHGGPDTLVPVMQGMARAGHRRQMVKVMNVAKFAAPMDITIEDPEDARRIDEMLWDRLEYSMMHIGGGIPRFLVQEWVPLQDECRILVIDGTPVTGAGCIEKFCPPYNDASHAFHPILEETRNSGALRSDPERVSLYVAAAQEAADALRREDPRLQHAILDFGWIPGRGPALIEVNPAAQFGLYAMDPQRMLQAMIKAAQHAPQIPPEQVTPQMR